MIKGKILVNGEITLLSPAIVGSGEDENSDMDVIKDEDGNPYIPATSFVGVLRSRIKPQGVSNNQLEKFWGSKNVKKHEEIWQSSIIVRDIYPKTYQISIREGVKIDNKRGIASDKGKFDYEIIERESVFDLYFEVNLNGEDDEFRKRMISTILSLLEREEISIGAKTNSGFGKIKLTKNNCYEFNFSDRNHVKKWFRYLTDGSLPPPTVLKQTPFSIDSKTIIIDAYFIIKNSLIVRSYNIDPLMPDTIHIKSIGKNILPGTSTRGAIRARAERIIKTLGIDDSIIDNLFGIAGPEVKNPKKGKLMVEESIIEDYPEEVQTRIKIDRFTGGTIEGALVESKPLFSTKNPKHIKLRFTINDYEDYEAGLMLLILKDLWTGDLPIGGEKSIGRGFLEGVKAEIHFDGKKIEFENPANLNSEEREMLNRFVKALENHGGKK